MTDFRSSLAPLFKPNEQMARIVAPRHGLTDVRPVFKWYLGDLDKLVSAADALTTSGGDPLTTVAADPITTAA